MYYKEYVRARKALIVFGIIWAALFVVTALLTVVIPMGFDLDTHAAAANAKIATQPWPALVGIAAVAAAIMATALGSTLAQENDGHLALAFTKPYSRDVSAAALMATDMGAILGGVLIGFIVMLLHYAIFHHPGSACCQPYRLVAGPDPVFNTLRSLLFPLAWYVIVVALSARLRGAGLVQTLIWPIAIGMAILATVPLGRGFQVWHQLFVALNAINPLQYLSEHTPAALGAAVLAAFVIVGWLVATLQWRRVEA